MNKYEEKLPIWPYNDYIWLNGSRMERRTKVQRLREWPCPHTHTPTHISLSLAHSLTRTQQHRLWQTRRAQQKIWSHHKHAHTHSASRQRQCRWSTCAVCRWVCDYFFLGLAYVFMLMMMSERVSEWVKWMRNEWGGREWATATLPLHIAASVVDVLRGLDGSKKQQLLLFEPFTHIWRKKEKTIPNVSYLCMSLVCVCVFVLCFLLLKRRAYTHRVRAIASRLVFCAHFAKYVIHNTQSQQFAKCFNCIIVVHRRSHLNVIFKYWVRTKIQLIYNQHFFLIIAKNKQTRSIEWTLNRILISRKVLLEL